MFLTILITVLIISVITIVLVYYKPQFKITIQILYTLIILVLAYFLVQSIMQPIKFNMERIKRESAAINKLKDIRKIQIAFKDKYGKYTSSFDTLINFVKTDSFKLERIVQVREWNQDEMTIEDALNAGILQETIQKYAVKDSLFTSNFPVDEIGLVPFGHGIKFHMASGEVESGSKIKVNVFEASVLYDDLLQGLDRQLVINYKDERYNLTNFEGLKVGSLTVANNNLGNWEK